MYKLLTIAGSDCSGGAGIQADLKTFTAHKMYGMSVISALTAQNTTGVFDILDVSPEFVAAQLDAVFTDIVPDAVKIGMVSNVDIIRVIAQRLSFYKAKNVVLDPVMVSTSGSRLLSEEALGALSEELFPIARVITPNIPESQFLCGFFIKTQKDMEKAAGDIYKKYGVNTLIKGGHFVMDATDLLLEGGEMAWILGERVDNMNTHGTGCTLSAAIACGLAKGDSLYDSVYYAKKYISGALLSGLDLGKGSGPLDHMWNLTVQVG